jgi:non-ribosomal peptide synthase protein (TIGR01720 family)
VHILAERHPALRARFVVTPQGVRQGAVTGPDAAPPVSRFEVVDDRAVDQLATRLHRGIDLARGPIARVALLVFPGERPEQVLLIVHHAVMDPYSWNVLLEELTALLEHDDAAALGPPSTSYLEWARRLAAYVRHHPDRLTPDYWLSQDRKSVSIPLDNPQAPGLEGAAACLTTELTAAQTHALRALARDSHATLFEHALAALGAGVQRWLGLEDPAAPGLDRRDAGAVLIAVSGHGREDLIPGLDLSRTIGWFTTSSPFHLPLPGQQDAGEHTARVVQAWRDVPGRGIDHGLLCHLHPDEDLRRRARAALAPAIAFDWHGERDMLATPHGEERPILFGAVTGGTGQWKDPDAPRAHVLDIMASVTEGRLVVEWHFSGDRIRRERIARLAEFFTEELCQRLG